MDDYPTSPRRHLIADRRRSELLSAARDVFAARGYHSASLDEIAHAAGISKALLHEHFRSERELYLALIDLHAQRLSDRVAAAAAAGPRAATRLEAGLDAFFAFVQEDRGAWRILFHGAVDAETAEVLDRMIAQVTALVATMIAEDPSSSAFDEEPTFEQTVEMLAQLVVGSAQGLASWWEGHPEVPRERLVEIAMDFGWLGLSHMRTGERWQDIRADETA